MIKPHTFNSPAEALAHAKKLLARGEISQKDFDRVKRELSASTTTTGNAADREMEKMIRDAKDGKGTITYTPNKKDPAEMSMDEYASWRKSGLAKRVR